MPQAVIVDVVRTPSGRGKPGGALSSVHPAQLLATTLRALVTRNRLDPELIDDVIAGCVTPVNDQSVNIARTAALTAGLPESVPGVTIDRQCGSSQQAVQFAAQGVMAGGYHVVIACGVESMSRVPMGSCTTSGDPFATLNQRYPHGLVNQGIAAQLIAAEHGLDRRALDTFAARSHALASASAAAGAFDNEIVPVPLDSSDDSKTHWTRDETVRPGTTPESLAGLEPAFRTDAAIARFPDLAWTITAGNSSPLTDGASAALIMSEHQAAELGLRPRARFHTFAVTGSDPYLMLTGVIPATRKALKKSGLDLADIGLFEVNEAFASIPLAWQLEFDADPDRLNVRGGAIALGHPLGGSGTRLLATMLNALEATGEQFALQVMCEGGGMANATIIERL